MNSEQDKPAGLPPRSPLLTNNPVSRLPACLPSGPEKKGDLVPSGHAGVPAEGDIVLIRIYRHVGGHFLGYRRWIPVLTYSNNQLTCHYDWRSNNTDCGAFSR